MTNPMTSKLLETWQLLGSVNPQELVEARLLAHYGSQIAAAPASSLLDPAPDWSHTAFSWFPEKRALAGKLLQLSPSFRTALRLENLTVHFLDAHAETIAEVPLAAHTMVEAYDRLRSTARNLLGALPPRPIENSALELPDHPLKHGTRFPDALPDAALRELSRWFANAATFLNHYAAQNAAASPVRCWPHHFDIASLTTFDPDADPETARSIGVGLSPGDGSYSEPYWYVLPWPHPKPDGLSSLDGGGYWHTEGWVGAVLTGSALTEGADAASQLDRLESFVRSAIEASKTALGL